MTGKRLVTMNLLRALDLAMLLLAYWCALRISSPLKLQAFLTASVPDRFSHVNLVFCLLVALVWHQAFTYADAYQSFRLSSFRTQARALLQATFFGSLGIEAVNLVAQTHLGKVFPVLLWIFSALNEVIVRSLIRVGLRYARQKGRNLRWMVIVGTNPRALEFGKEIMGQRQLGYVVAGFLAEDGQVTAAAGDIEIIGEVSDLPILLRKIVVDEVALSLPLHSHMEQITAVCQVCRDHGIITRLVADSVGPSLSISRMDALGSFGLLTVIPESSVSASRLAKAIFDVTVASLLLILASPLLALIGVAIALTSPGPIFFHQVRLGENKRKFRMHKFRTMVVNAESQVEHLNATQVNSAPTFKMRQDPRITPIGRILRRYSLDELPQLFNVVKLEMSLVGPRPLPLRDYEGFERDHHFRRFSVKPGLSCLWQISGRSDIDFEEWMKLDMEYIDRWSFWLDLKILAKTLPAVVRGSGAY